MSLTRFTIKKELGSGVYSHVYLAHDKLKDCEVAIKIISPQHTRRLEKPLNREFELGQRYHQICPRVVSYAESLEFILPPWRELPEDWQDDRCRVMVMNYLNGHQVEDFMYMGRMITPEQCLDMLIQLGNSIYLLHKNNLVHGDINLSNILLSPFPLPSVSQGTNSSSEVSPSVPPPEIISKEVISNENPPKEVLKEPSTLGKYYLIDLGGAADLTKTLVEQNYRIMASPLFTHPLLYEISSDPTLQRLSNDQRIALMKANDVYALIIVGLAMMNPSVITSQDRQLMLFQFDDKIIPTFDTYLKKYRDNNLAVMLFDTIYFQYRQHKNIGLPMNDYKDGYFLSIDSFLELLYTMVDVRA